jgi:hypothetical protein
MRDIHVGSPTFRFCETTGTAVKGNRSDGKKFIPSDNNGAWRLDSSAAYDLEATEATTGLNAIRRPDTKTSCCNLTDCRPTSGRQVDDHYEVKINGAWISVPADKILKKSAPDLGFHVCAPFNFTGQPQQIYCVVVPPEI